MKKVWFSCYKSNKFVPRAVVLKREFFQLILQIHMLFPAQYSIFVQDCPNNRKYGFSSLKKTRKCAASHSFKFQKGSLKYVEVRWSTLKYVEVRLYRLILPYRKTMSNIWKYCLRKKKWLQLSLLNPLRIFFWAFWNPKYIGSFKPRSLWGEASKEGILQLSRPHGW